MRVGSREHRDLFCRTFIDTHVPFAPEELPWPELDGKYLARLHAFPFWSYARAIEQRAGRMVTAFAQTLEDPLIREAVAVQGVEETRHGKLMSHVLDRYGIDAPVIPVGDPPATRDDFCIFGFGECTDSFVGFGAFALARERGLFPAALLGIFENVLYEEARHITFFVNWWRYEEARAGRDRPFQRTFNSLRYHVRASIGTATGATDMPAVPTKLDDPELDAMVKSITPVMLLEAALAENRRVMARIDRRLLRPTVMPILATSLLLGLRMLPPRKATAKATALHANGTAPVAVRRGSAVA